MTENNNVLLFVSHHSTQADLASTVEAALAAHGISCWLAPRDVPPGEPFDRAIQRAIEKATGILLLLSQKSDVSRHVKRELILADSAGKPIIPLRLEPMEPKELRYLLADSQWIDWTEENNAVLRALAAQARLFANLQKSEDGDFGSSQNDSEAAISRARAQSPSREEEKAQRFTTNGEASGGSVSSQHGTQLVTPNIAPEDTLAWTDETLLAPSSDNAGDETLSEIGRSGSRLRLIQNGQNRWNLRLVFALVAATALVAFLFLSVSINEIPDDFVQENGPQDGVETTTSGLRYEILESGDDGPTPGPDDAVLVNFVGRLANGEVFDVAEFTPIRIDQVIPGFAEAVQQMPRGARHRVWIPPSLGYGDNPPPNSPIRQDTIIEFEIELIDFLPAADMEARLQELRTANQSAQ